MCRICLNLVVLRSNDIEAAAEFYRSLELVFILHRHGKGPEHFAAELAGGVFEIYPMTDDGLSTLGIRIGLSVPSLDDALAALQPYPEAIISPAKKVPVGISSGRERPGWASDRALAVATAFGNRLISTWRNRHT
jgi:lactoylglutathione lyase